MIPNIIDRRDHPYRCKNINSAIEGVEHGNSCVDADQAPEEAPLEVIDYDSREGLSVADAVAWANSQRCPVTLFFYDAGRGTIGEEHFKACVCRMNDDN